MENFKKNRVGIYNRCSTEEEAQINALETQAQESREIAERKGWEITAQYIESESGTTTRKRLEYQKMLEDMENDIFDIVMIKSIDRLMRSTKDWYIFIDKVVSYNKKLYIYMDNKFYEADDALITGIKAILAEDFSRELSKKIKHAHKRRQDTKSGLNITVPLFGWDKIKKNEYVINSEEAASYRLAFAMAYEGHGFYTIAKYMAEQGVRSKTTGKEISITQWRKMLYSPRAHGTVVLHTREYDFHTKKYIPVPEKDWIYVENALPPIVSREYQDMVFERLRSRSEACHSGNAAKSMSKTGTHDLSGKMICGCCGAVYYRTLYHRGESGEQAAWKCSNRIAYGASACKNINVIERTVLQVMEKACLGHYEKISGNNKNHIVEETLRIAGIAFKAGDMEKERKMLERELCEQEKKKAVLFDKLMNEVIDDNDFKMANKGVTAKMEELKIKIEKIKEKISSRNDIESRIRQIREILQEGQLIQKAELKDLLGKIEKIIVYPDKQLEIVFDKSRIAVCFPEDKCLLAKIKVPYIHKSAYELQQEDLEETLIQLFKDYPDIVLKDISDRVNKSYYAVRKAAASLQEKGRLDYCRKGNGHVEWHVVDDK